MTPSNQFVALVRFIFRLPRMPLDATSRRPPLWLAVLGGAGLGLLWGILARIWMRLIATSPEFSIPGTAAILLIATLFGALSGLALAARRRGWPGWRQSVPRGLAVLFFLPFGSAGGGPLMMTVLLATLAATRGALAGLWALAGLTLLVATGSDIGVPPIAAAGIPAAAIVLTIWKWLVRRRAGNQALMRADRWIERGGRALLLLLAAGGLVLVAQEIMHNRPGLAGVVYVLCYLLLLYPLFLALRVGLDPRGA